MNGDAGGPSALAAALTGEVRTVGRSHRLHRPRGGFCGRGYCQQCPIRGQAGGSGLACETSAADGVPRLAPDLVRVAGLVGERVEPWFYERRFLRPRFLRQPALEVIRRLSAARPVPRGPASPGGPARRIECDVLVVGGGPAGIAAAAAIGPRARVVLVTRAMPGGSLPMSDAMRRGVDADLATLESSGAEVLGSTLCVGLYEDDGIAAGVGPSGPLTIAAERLLVATGAYDRSLTVPGADLPGVVGLRGFELLGAQGAFAGARRIGVVGGPAEVARAVAAVEAFGLSLAWVAGPGELSRGEPTRRLAAIEGRSRVRAAILDGGERRPADVIVLGFSQPTYELQLQNGREPSFAGAPTVVRTRGSGRLPMLVVGEAAGVVGPATARETAASEAREWLRSGDVPEETSSPQLPPATTGPLPDAVVCVCEDVRVRDLDRCLDEGFDDVEQLKRRSGAGTGACQGKLCLCLIAEVMQARGRAPALPTSRPPIRPVRVAALGGAAG